MELIFSIFDSKWFAPTLIALMIICGCVGLIRGRVKDRTRSVFLYNAWTKETGNPKQLTLEEFLALKTKYEDGGRVMIGNECTPNKHEQK